jgi:hypothetical protein
MQFLFRQPGYDRESAARFVYRSLSKSARDSLTDLGGKGNNQRATWQSIAGWRDNVSGASVPDSLKEERYAYEFTVQQLNTNMNGPAEKRAKDMLWIIEKQID